MMIDRIPYAPVVKRGYLGDDRGVLLFQFNPNAFKDSKGVDYSEIKSLGMSYPILQYLGGKTRVITFSLYANGKEGTGPAAVTNVINQLDKFLPTPGGTQFVSPNSLVFAFGTFVVSCKLVTYDTDFTDFTPDLEPIEATFSITLNVIQ